jgi:hypothetical protein
MTETIEKISNRFRGLIGLPSKMFGFEVNFSIVAFVSFWVKYT